MDLALRRLASSIEGRFQDLAIQDGYAEMYDDLPELGGVLSIFHQLLDSHFRSINQVISGSGHYWADSSRELLSVLEAFRELLRGVERLGVELIVDPDYGSAIEWCEGWIVPSGGSSVPDGASTIAVISFEPVFHVGPSLPNFIRGDRDRELKLEGEGSYAIVHSYVDPLYDTRFALKTLKRGAAEKEKQRFRREFELMSNIDFPHIVKAFCFDEDGGRYTMEYCNYTLYEYVRSRNNELPFQIRKKMAMQFLYGVAHIHRKKILHRDLSLHNVLVREFDQPAIHLKISDFGLAATGGSQLTQSNTEMKGAIRDPQLEEFSKYSMLNEIYAVGVILNYIFTGRQSWSYAECRLREIVEKCVDPQVGQRYSSVSQILADVSELISGRAE